MATLSPEQLSGYLQRVGHSGAARPDLHTLATVHNRHLRTLPFENLSLHLDAARKQHEIRTDLDSVYRKLVQSGKRGGYCFEHNALMSAALRALGFDVLDIGARVVRPTPDALLMGGHNHQMLLVHLEQRTWLADVGFGGSSFPLPLLLHEGVHKYAPPPRDSTLADAYRDLDGAAELPVEHMRSYRLRLGLPFSYDEPDPTAAATPLFASQVGFYLQRQSAVDGRWVDQYFFRLDQFLPQDYEQMNFNMVANPASHFNNNLLVALQTEEGRVTIENDAFRQWRTGEAAPAHETCIKGEEQLLRILRQHFGIELE